MNYRSIKERLKKAIAVGTLVPVCTLWAFPASTNYKLRSLEFGGGGGVSSSETFRAEATLGELTASASSELYTIQSGLQYVQMASVSARPALVNEAQWYNKLRITLPPDADPTDATTYAIAITDDDWVTTRYVQNDNTIGDTLGTDDFQTYAQWGGESGELIIGLADDTTYKVKVKSRQGIYTESGYGPEASAATSALSVTFDIDVHTEDTETASPYSVSLSDLSAGSVTTALKKIWIDFATNAESGGAVYIYDANEGLYSSTVEHTIDSYSGNLSTAPEGFGIRSDSVSATNGTLVPQSPFNDVSDTVGAVTTTIRELYTSGGSPVTGGRGSVLIKAKSAEQTPAASDYGDILTIIAAGMF